MASSKKSTALTCVVRHIKVNAVDKRVLPEPASSLTITYCEEAAVNHMACCERPLHVPEDRVFDFDYLADPLMETDPRAAYLRLRAAPELVWTPRNEGHWIATRYDTIFEVFSNPDRFSSFPYLIPKSVAPHDHPLPLAEMDPPEHTKYRQLLMPLLNAKVVRSFEEKARATLIELTEAVRHKGECEFVDAVAARFPIYLVMDWLDLPRQDREMLMADVAKVLGPYPPEIRRAAREATERYVASLALQRRGSSGEDLISRLVNGIVDGKLVDAEKGIAMASNLVMGGLDTVTSSLGLITMYLAQNPGKQTQLRNNPALIPTAAEELFRYIAPPALARCVKHDMEFRGVQLKAGEQILAPLILAGLDPAVNTDPLEVDFARKAPRHLAFSTGPHFCPGSPLARLEVQIFLQEWLARIPKFHIKPGTVPKTVGGIVMGVRNLQLEW